MDSRPIVGGYLQDSSNVFAQNRLLKLGVGIIACVTLWNGYVINNLKDTIRTEILPPYSEKKWVITGNDANDDYLADMARHIVQSLGTWNPGSVRIQLNQLLRYIHPDAYPKYRDQFKRIADRAERYASVSFAVQWDPGQAIVRHGNSLKLYVVRRRIAGNQVSRTEKVEYVIQFVIESGRFWVTDIFENTAKRNEDPA